VWQRLDAHLPTAVVVLKPDYVRDVDLRARRFAELRQESPEKYESYVDLEVGVWTRYRISVEGNKARLYVHGGGPTLVCSQNQITCRINGLPSASQGCYATLREPLHMT
jgi:hypothetical protein